MATSDESKIPNERNKENKRGKFHQIIHILIFKGAHSIYSTQFFSLFFFFSFFVLSLNLKTTFCVVVTGHSVLLLLFFFFFETRKQTTHTKIKIKIARDCSGLAKSPTHTYIYEARIWLLYVILNRGSFHSGSQL